MKNKVFMNCNWENLLYVNYQIEPKCVEHLLPEDIELDLLNGKAMISFVCFQFSKAKLFGIKIPFHQNFPEINIRTYVRSKKNPHIKGIYFISEMVPDFMTFFVGKYIYGEPFSLFNVKSRIDKIVLNYNIKNQKTDIEISVDTDFRLNSTSKNDEQSFVIDRVYAFCGKKGESSKIYQVVHKDWNLLYSESPNVSIKKIKHLDNNLENKILQSSPISVYITDGSNVDVIKNIEI